MTVDELLKQLNNWAVDGKRDAEVVVELGDGSTESLVYLPDDFYVAHGRVVIG